MATTYVRDDISTISYQTSGDVPLPMIGSSTTVARGKAWIYGGRLATDHAHVGDLYELDLHTLKWTKVRQEQDDIPCPRYYHSMNYWNEYLVLFGGRGNGQTGTAQRSRVLNDVRFFDLGKRQWLPDSPSQQFQHLGDTEPVRDSSADGRCGHLSAVYGDHLFVCGGQTVDGTWIEDLCLYDLVSKQWLSCHPYRHRQSIYHSLAVSPTLKVATYEAQLSALGSRENLFIHLPYSVPSSANSPGSVYICDFSSSPPRLEMFEADRQANIQVQNKRLSSATYLPPEIRFPSGGVLGNHLIVAGSISQTFSVWALNLRTLEWKQLDCGGALLSSSWHTAVPWSSQNKLVIFGCCSDLPANSRTQLACSWTHVAMMDVETYGIYQPPFRSLDVRAQRSGLGALASGIDANFTVACDDGRELRCSRKLLEERWPWFREQRTLLLQEAVNATDTIHGHPTIRSNGSQPAKQLDKRMSLRRLAFGQSYAVTLAFLQYFHTLALLTPLQHAPPVLSMLLVFSRDYHLPHLRELVKHAMHIALSKSTAQGVCEIARECKCYGLERRAQRLLATSKDGISPVSRAGPGGRLRALSASDAAARHPIPGPDTSRSELLQKQAQHHEQLPPLPVALDAADGYSPPIPSVPPLQPQDATSWVGRPRAVTSASVVRESVLSESSTLLSKSLPSKVSLDVASLGSSSISLSDRSVYSETSKSSFARILSPRKDKSTSKEAKEQMKLIQREEARWRKEHIISNYHTQPAKQVKVAFL